LAKGDGGLRGVKATAGAVETVAAEPARRGLVVGDGDGGKAAGGGVKAVTGAVCGWQAVERMPLAGRRRGGDEDAVPVCAAAGAEMRRSCR
jgi:hypothetical protein